MILLQALINAIYTNHPRDSFLFATTLGPQHTSITIAYYEMPLSVSDISYINSQLDYKEVKTS